MINIDELKFDEKGLIPAIVVNAQTKKVLTPYPLWPNTKSEVFQ